MAHIPECPRVPVKRVMKILPVEYLEAMEHNQLIAHCCRHPENHEIEAFRSKEEEKLPDIYIFHCTCGRRHIRFLCDGRGVEPDPRPHWR